MSDDRPLVERLREASDHGFDLTATDLFDESADRIAALETELAEVKGELERANDRICESAAGTTADGVSVLSWEPVWFSSPDHDGESHFYVASSLTWKGIAKGYSTREAALAAAKSSLPKKLHDTSGNGKDAAAKEAKA